MDPVGGVEHAQKVRREIGRVNDAGHHDLGAVGDRMEGLLVFVLERNGHGGKGSVVARFLVQRIHLDGRAEPVVSLFDPLAGVHDGEAGPARFAVHANGLLELDAVPIRVLARETKGSGASCLRHGHRHGGWLRFRAVEFLASIRALPDADGFRGRVKLVDAGVRQEDARRRPGRPLLLGRKNGPRMNVRRGDFAARRGVRDPRRHENGHDAGKGA